MKPTKYRKKPIEITAIQFLDAPSAERIRAEFGDAIRFDIGFLLIDTLEGTMRAKVGDWIVRGVQREVYPVKPDIFAATYGPAGEQEEPSGRLLADLIEQHRPVMHPSPMTYGDIHDVQCAACDGNQWRMIRPATDPIPECRMWIRAKALGLVQDAPAVVQSDVV